MASSTTAAASVSFGRELAPALPQLFDARLQISHGLHPTQQPSRRSATSSSRSMGCTTATRTKPAPSSP